MTKPFSLSPQIMATSHDGPTRIHMAGSTRTPLPPSTYASSTDPSQHEHVNRTFVQTVRIRQLIREQWGAGECREQKNENINQPRYCSLWELRRKYNASSDCIVYCITLTDINAPTETSHTSIITPWEAIVENKKIMHQHHRCLVMTAASYHPSTRVAFSTMKTNEIWNWQTIQPSLISLEYTHPTPFI